MNKKGFLNIIIAVVIAVVIGGGIYMFRKDRQEGQEALIKSTGLSQELLNITLVKEYISGESGSIDQSLLPFTSDNYQLDLRLVAEWPKYKSSYFPNGVPKFHEDPLGDGKASTIDHSPDKKHALQFPTNEHGGANLWDLENQFVYQLCSHCGIVGSYWMNSSKFILLNIIQSEDGKYRKVIQLFDLANKTISVSLSAGFMSPFPAQSATQTKPAVSQLVAGTVTVKIALTGLHDEIGSGEKFGCGDTVVMVPRQIPKTPQVLNAAFKELFAAPSSINYNGHDLYNVIHSMGTYAPNPLQFDSAKIDSGVAKIYFKAIEGTFGATGGVCDDPRVRPVIEATAKQFPTVKSVEIYLNNKLFDWTDFGSQR